jgi:ferredoxin
MRIVVDRDLCQGHGVCESEAPGVFEVGKDHQVIVLEERPPEDRRAELEDAVRFCPTHALSLVDD